MFEFIKSNRVKFACAATLLLVCFAYAFAGPDTQSQTSLGDVVKNCNSYKFVNVKFGAYFNKLEFINVPFYTPFNKEDYVAFSVWEPGTRLWVKEEYSASFPFLFVRKDSDYLPILLQLKKYTVIDIGGVVQNTFDNVPWIEVTSLKKFGKTRLNDESLFHMIQGYKFAAEGQLAPGLDEFNSALDTKLPDYCSGEIYKQIAVISYSLGDKENALRNAKASLVLVPGDVLLEGIVEALKGIEPQEVPAVEPPPPQDEPIEEVKPVEQPVEPPPANTGVSELQMKEYVDRIASLELEKVALQAEVDNRNQNAMAMEATIVDLKSKLDLFASTPPANDDTESLKANLDALQKEYNEHLDGFKDYVASTQGNIQTRDAKIAELEQKMAALEAIRAQLEERLNNAAVQAPPEPTPVEELKPTPPNDKHTTDFDSEDWDEFGE